jgi:hypothetical protein
MLCNKVTFDEKIGLVASAETETDKLIWQLAATSMTVFQGGHPQQPLHSIQ